MRAALAKDNVSGDNEFGVAFLGAEAFSGTGRGFVGAALGRVGGVACGCSGERGLLVLMVLGLEERWAVEREGSEAGRVGGGRGGENCTGRE